jgi:hypothetical protein
LKIVFSENAQLHLIHKKKAKKIPFFTSLKRILRMIFFTASPKHNPKMKRKSERLIEARAL